ncbi:OST-HTH/LOTUS domain protein [compost metagenome]
MDLLYTRRFDGFCLVSSDSDFTRLAARLREEGLTVYGFGEEKTPKPFVSACDKFIYTEILRAVTPEPPVESVANDGKAAAANEPAKPAAKPRSQKVPVEFIAQVLDDIADDDDDWVQLGVLGQNIGKLRPAFDPRLYGFKKLSDLIKGYPKRFELQARGSTASGGKDLYVRSLTASK